MAVDSRAFCAGPKQGCARPRPAIMVQPLLRRARFRRADGPDVKEFSQDQVRARRLARLLLLKRATFAFSSSFEVKVFSAARRGRRFFFSGTKFSKSRHCRRCPSMHRIGMSRCMSARAIQTVLLSTLSSAIPRFERRLAGFPPATEPFGGGVDGRNSDEVPRPGCVPMTSRTRAFAPISTRGSPPAAGRAAGEN